MPGAKSTPACWARQWPSSLARLISVMCRGWSAATRARICLAWSHRVQSAWVSRVISAAAAVGVAGDGHHLVDAGCFDLAGLLLQVGHLVPARLAGQALLEVEQDRLALELRQADAAAAARGEGEGGRWAAGARLADLVAAAAGRRGGVVEHRIQHADERDDGDDARAPLEAAAPGSDVRWDLGGGCSGGAGGCWADASHQCWSWSSGVRGQGSRIRSPGYREPAGGCCRCRLGCRPGEGGCRGG